MFTFSVVREQSRIRLKSHAAMFVKNVLYFLIQYLFYVLYCILDLSDFDVWSCNTGSIKGYTCFFAY